MKKSWKIIVISLLTILLVRFGLQPKWNSHYDRAYTGHWLETKIGMLCIIDGNISGLGSSSYIGLWIGKPIGACTFAIGKWNNKPHIQIVAPESDRIIFSK